MSKFDKKDRRSGRRKWDENPYETNYDCFNIRDFKNGDSIMVYDEGSRVKGIVTNVDFDTRSVHYKTAYSESNSTNLNNVLFLDGYSQGWLDIENGIN